jgi:prepilin-type N-terminal cleavage/methylation domain-containing protein
VRILQSGGVSSRRTDARKGRTSEGPRGFSLVEMVMVLVILSVGFVGMRASTGYMMTRTIHPDLRSERMSAVGQAAETVRGTPWSDVARLCADSTFRIDPYVVRCEVTRPSATLQRVRLVSTGPGVRDGHVQPAVVETFVISRAQPAPGG